MYTVVFDIDLTIADNFGYMNLDGIKRNHAFYVDEFEKRGLLIRILGTWYIIFPAVLEFIRWLDTRGVRIAFFSAGKHDRNESLVTEILKRAFGESTDAVKDRKIPTYSRHNLTEDRSKDLNLVLLPGQKLEEVVIIDDQPMRVIKKQRKQAFPVNSTYHQHFGFIQQCKPSGADGNHFFYITAMLDAAMMYASNHKVSLTDALQALHQTKPEPETLYTHGQTILQQVNKQLVLVRPGQLFATDYSPSIPSDYHQMFVREMEDEESWKRCQLLAEEVEERRGYTESYEAFHWSALTQTYFAECRRLRLPYGVISESDSSSSFDEIPELDAAPRGRRYVRA